MTKVNPILSFLIGIIALLILVFVIHVTVLGSLGLEKYDDKIVLSYVINFLLAATIYIGLYSLRNRLKTQIGFIFMAGSFLKFLFFFILFYPAYKVDGEIDTSEFAAFFIPYLVCLVVETISTAKMLQKME
ncbi:DUF6168 family protein [Kriegella aquimaris]|uniref:ATP synthase protein I n=1 Tax=Kriegella aquimaris TaxID=192904 RepID=A0A1G9QKC9_9FLAO|nr:DUF6168 family protein [Kriegella aquimaris]SDM11370.1 hypothetical protein SAMN04488514_10581 [Kriegella aquimaris]